MPEPLDAFIFFFSIGITIFVVWLSIRHRIRRINVKIPPAPPRLASAAQMVATLRRIATAIIAGIIVIGVGGLFIPGNLVFPICASILSINGMSLLAKTWATAANHALGERNSLSRYVRDILIRMSGRDKKPRTPGLCVRSKVFYCTFEKRPYPMGCKKRGQMPKKRLTLLIFCSISFLTAAGAANLLIWQGGHMNTTGQQTLEHHGLASTSAISTIGSYDTPGWAEHVFVSGDVAYVADGSGLQCINVTNPAAPSLLGTCDPSGAESHVFVSGDVAYVAGTTSGLRCINITNPAAPLLLGSRDTPGTAVGVFVSGDVAYVADRELGLQCINVTNPAAPAILGAYDTPGIAYDVFVSGSIAYVADSGSGLQCINVANPAAPSLLGTYNTPGIAYNVFVSGNVAYVADETSLQCINVANPAAPAILGAYDTPAFARGVFVSGSVAYVADRPSGLQCINVANPAAPALLGSYNTPGDAFGLFVSGDVAYVADGNTGLLCIDVSSLGRAVQDPLNDIWYYIIGGVVGLGVVVSVVVVVKKRKGAAKPKGDLLVDGGREAEGEPLNWKL